MNIPEGISSRPSLSNHSNSLFDPTVSNSMSKKGQTGYTEQHAGVNLNAGMERSEKTPIIVTDANINQLSSTHDIVEEEFTIGVPMVRPKPNFLQILRQGGAKGDFLNFTRKEVCSYLKEYIRSRQLYDTNNPRIVFCKGDPLGEVFQCETFTVNEAMKLIDENCYQLPDTCIKTKHRLVAIPKAHSTETQVTTSVAGPSYVHTSGPLITSQAGNQSTQSSTVSHSASDHRNGNQSSNVTTLSPSASDLRTGNQSSQPSTLTHSTDSDTTCSNNSKNKKKKEGKRTTSDSSSSSGRQRQTSLSINISDAMAGSSSYPCYPSVQVDSETDEDKQDGEIDDEEGSVIAFEYEVTSEDDEIISSTASISGISENDVFIVCGDSDMEFWADSSDSELSDGDKWVCLECDIENSPLHGYCGNCGKMRPGWLRQKEGQRKRQLDKSYSEIKDRLSSSECSDIGQPQQKLRRRHSTTIDSVERIQEEANDSGICAFSSQPSSQEDIKLETLKTSKICDDFHLPLITDKLSTSETYRTLLNYRSTESNDTIASSMILNHQSENEHSQHLSDHSTLDNKKGESQKSEMCIICLKCPKTASIVHGSTGHQVCCLRCARRLKRRRKPCPVCRRTIQKVIRNFMV